MPAATAPSADALDEAIRLLEEAARLIRAHRDSTPRAETWRLTQRESDVLRLLKEGRSNRDIATALDISLNTARTHVSRVLAKLYVRSRWQLLATADDLRVGLRSAGDRTNVLVLTGRRPSR
jgi:DNA-binding NarL/FixJ family response regulator